MVDDWAISLLSGLVGAVIGAVVGGRISAKGSVDAVRAAQRDLEIDEIRRQKITCLVNLVGLRFTLTGENSLASHDDKSKAMFELNRAVALWSNDLKVSNLLRDVRAGSTPQNLGDLLRSMAIDTRLSFDQLSDSDLQTPFQIR